MIQISFIKCKITYILIKKGTVLDKNFVGKQLKQIRIQRGISQEKLSELVDISPRQMCVIENGNSIPSLDTFIKIAKNLHFDINEFFGIEYEPTENIRNEIIEKIKTVDRKQLNLLNDIVDAVARNA